MVREMLTERGKKAGRRGKNTDIKVPSPEASSYIIYHHHS